MVCGVLCTGCCEEKIECNAYMPSVIGTIVSIDNNQINIIVAEDTKEISKDEMIVLQFRRKEILEARIRELNLTEGSVIRVLYTEIKEVNGEKRIDVKVSGNVILWQ